MTVKSKPSSLAFPKLAIPGVIFLLGLLLTLWLQVFAGDGAFFSSDAGLKALLSQQIAAQIKAGSFPLSMAIDSGNSTADWVSQLWSQGLAPVVAPFATDVGSQRFVAFSFIFPLLTAPFYALFKGPGLYVVPIVSLWIVWGRFWQIGLRAGWDAASLSLGLFALIFASPLSLYGSMYWEHTLAVALAFWGITALLYPRKSFVPYTYLSGSRLLISGVLVGLSVWFRPEFAALVLAVCFVAIAGWLFPKWRLITPLSLVDVGIFIGSIACIVGVFLALNYAVYGHPLGLHGLQIVNQAWAGSPLLQALVSYSQTLFGLWRYVPIAVLAVIAALCSPEFRRANLKTTNRFKGFKTPNVEEIGIISPAQNSPLPGRAALLLCCLFVVALPLILPGGIGGKQWGPRLYLILVPLLSLVLAEQLRVGFFQNWARRLLLVGAAIALAFGIHINTLNGAFNVYSDPQTRSTSLLANYVLVKDAIAQLKAQPTPWIATDRQSAAHQLWSALPSKTFFLAQTTDEIVQLANALSTQNESAFLYVCQANYECAVAETSELTLANGNKLSFESMGQFGRYPLYKVEISS